MTTSDDVKRVDAILEAMGHIARQYPPTEVCADVVAHCRQSTYPGDQYGPASTETAIELSGGFVVAGQLEAVLEELAAVIEKHRI